MSQEESAHSLPLTAGADNGELPMELLKAKLSDVAVSAVHVFRDDSFETATQIVAALIGPRQQRLLHRAVPPENQLVMAQMIQKYIQEGKRIPVLSPAAVKQPPFKIGFSELYVLQVMKDLQRRVQCVYPPGLHVVMRMENLTLTEVVPDGIKNLDHYTQCANAFRALARYLKMDFVDVKLESEIMDIEEFHHRVTKFSQHFIRYFAAKDEHSEVGLSELRKEGWKGSIPEEAREYFRRCYRKKYHFLTEDEREGIIANYFSCTLARRQLRGVGDANEPNWKYGRMEVAFMPPVPCSEEFEKTRVWYRSQLNTPSRSAFWRTVAVTHGGQSPAIGIADLDDDPEGKLRSAPRLSIKLSEEVSLEVIVKQK